MTPPLITVALDLDDGLYRLHATSYGSTQPAGERLFRAPPHPDIRFTHESQEQAEKDAATLREYIEVKWGKKVSKKKLREQGAT